MSVSMSAHRYYSEPYEWYAEQLKGFAFSFFNVFFYYNMAAVFSDYFEKCIMSQCNAVEEVKDGVPNRHGVAHSWYRKYPNKKAALNAILLTDFIIQLNPIRTV